MKEEGRSDDSSPGVLCNVPKRSGLDISWLKLIGTHVPFRSQATLQVVPGSDYFFRYTANTVCSSANAVQLLGRHGTPVAADTSSIGSRLAGLESRRRGEVKSSKGA